MTGSHLETPPHARARPRPHRDGDRGSRPGKVLSSWARRYRAGAIIALDGEELRTAFVVLSGWLAVSKLTRDGQKQIIDFALPGDFLNPTSADNATVAVQIEAVSPAIVSVMPVTVWHRLLDKFDDLRALDARCRAGVQSRWSERMLRLGKGRAETRIAYALIELYVRLDAIGEVSDGAFHLPLTQVHMGDFAGLSSVHVCRTMQRLSRQGIIRVRDHMDIAILDMDSLSAIAGIDPATLADQIVAMP